CVLALSIGRSRAVSTIQLALEFGLAIAGMMLIAPLTEDIHYVYLVIPLAAVATALVAKWRPGPVTFAFAGMLVPGYVALSMPMMVEILFAFDTRVPTLIAGPPLLLTGVMVYILLLVTVLLLVTLRWYRMAPGRPVFEGRRPTFEATHPGLRDALVQ